MTAQELSKFIHENARISGVRVIIQAVNVAMRERQSNHADTIVACAQILGQAIARTDVICAPELRQGILQMIDNYAMETVLANEEGAE